MAVISRSTSVRLLVIRLSAMGDVAMVAPVLVALRRNYPNLRITVLTPKFLQPFFREVGNIEFFAPDLKGRHKGVAGLLRLGRMTAHGSEFRLSHSTKGKFIRSTRCAR